MGNNLFSSTYCNIYNYILIYFLQLTHGNNDYFKTPEQGKLSKGHHA